MRKCEPGPFTPRLYVGIGALWGAAVSALFLLQAFGLLKL